MYKYFANQLQICLANGQNCIAFCYAILNNTELRSILLDAIMNTFFPEWHLPACTLATGKSLAQLAWNARFLSVSIILLLIFR